MDEILKAIRQQIIPILVSAGIAASLAFAQSVASHAGFCPAPLTTTSEVAFWGASFKGMHSLASMTLKLWQA